MSAVPAAATDCVAFLEELRRTGIELRIDGSRLVVLGRQSAYSPELRAKLLVLKPEIIAHLRREADAASVSYAQSERAWAVTVVGHLARAFGYGDELARLAAEMVAKRPSGAAFRVGADVISISIGEGKEIRLHRLPQPWATPLLT